MSSVVSFLRDTIAVPLLDFVYPPLCFTCGTVLTGGSIKICKDCWGSLKTVSRSDEVWKEIYGKLQTEQHVDDVLSCFLFEKKGALQGIIHLLKYQGMKSFGLQLGREIGMKILSDTVYCQAELLIPIPLHKRKMRERGYNQSEFLCAGIAEVTRIGIATHMLERKKHTTSQTQLSVSERKENVRDAFRFLPPVSSPVNGKTVVLVDDVITTGSTIDACAEVLRKNGARSVLAACVALAP